MELLLLLYYYDLLLLLLIQGRTVKASPGWWWIRTFSLKPQRQKIISIIPLKVAAWFCVSSDSLGISATPSQFKMSSKLYFAEIIKCDEQNSLAKSHNGSQKGKSVSCGDTGGPWVTEGRQEPKVGQEAPNQNLSIVFSYNKKHFGLITARGQERTTEEERFSISGRSFPSFCSRPPSSALTEESGTTLRHFLLLRFYSNYWNFLQEEKSLFSQIWQQKPASMKCSELTQVSIQKLKMWYIFNAAVFDVALCVRKLSGCKVALNINEGIILHIWKWLEENVSAPRVGADRHALAAFVCVTSKQDTQTAALPEPDISGRFRHFTIHF